MTEVAVCEGRLVAWVPGRLVNPLNGAHGHWSVKARERKAWRDRTQLVVQDAMRRGRWNYRADAAKVVVLTAYVWNLFDEDGLASSLKPLVDGLRDAQLIHADDPKSGHRFVRRQAINRKHRGVEIVVEPRPWGEGVDAIPAVARASLTPTTARGATGGGRVSDDDGFVEDEYDADGPEPECLICCGDGYVYGEDMGDPLWYDADEVVTCTSCRGSGLRKDMTWM